MKRVLLSLRPTGELLSCSMAPSCSQGGAQIAWLPIQSPSSQPHRLTMMLEETSSSSSTSSSPSALGPTAPSKPELSAVDAMPSSPERRRAAACTRATEAPRPRHPDGNQPADIERTRACVSLWSGCDRARGPPPCAAAHGLQLQGDGFHPNAAT